MKKRRGPLGRRFKNRVYSEIDRIPMGRASKKLSPGCLVLEGGAFRGVYTQGVLDAFMEKDLNFEAVVGVSAGALAGLNYVSGQIGRSARINLKYRHDSEYIGLRAYEESGSPLNLDFILHTNHKLEPFDYESFQASPQRVVAVATNCQTGRPEYFERGQVEDFFAAVKASASMPYLSPMVNVGGKLCLDGGCSCKIAYSWALAHDFEKVVIIKTRDRSFRKKPLDTKPLTKRLYRHYPEFADLLEKSDEEYNWECDQVAKLEETGRAFVIAPSQPVTVGRLEPDMEKLGSLYWLGYEDAYREMDRLRAYLEK